MTIVSSFPFHRARVVSARASRAGPLVSLCDQAVLSAANMCTTIVVGRVCSRRELGLYAATYSLALVATAVQAAFITTPYTMLSPMVVDDLRASKRGGALAMLFCLSTFWLLGCFALAATVAVLGKGNSLAFSTIGVVGVSLAVREFARRVSCAEMDFFSAFLTDSVGAVLQLGAVGVLGLSGLLNADTALLAVAAASGLAGMGWLFATASWKDLSWRYAIADLRSHWAFARWLLPGGAMYSVSFDQYPAVIAAACGLPEAALWAACSGVMALTNPIVQALTVDTAPRIAHSYANGGLAALGKSIAHSTRLALILSVPIIVVLALFGGDLAVLMYGSQYADAGPIVRLLAVAFPLNIASLALAAGMLVLRRPEFDFSVNALCLCAFCSAGVFSIGRHGAAGAAMSLIVVYSVALLARAGFFRTALQAHRNRVRDARGLPSLSGAPPV
jgi:O-antigen/teichoic acid export membrane protein